MLTVRERELIIRWHEQGKKQQQIAGLIGCSQPVVWAWIQRYKSGGSLTTAPRSGRPTKLSKKRLSSLKEKVRAYILEANERFCSVSTKQISEIIRQEIGENFSLRHVERILHKIGFSRIKPRPMHVKHDAQKVAEFRDEFKKNFKRGTWGISS